MTSQDPHSSQHRIHLVSDHAALVQQRLSQRTWRLVLAESCTGGMAAAKLTTVPGISACFCGSMVVYRPTSKQTWLDIDAELLRRYSAESAQVTAALAERVLRSTPEADIAAAITGHLGPDAPPEVDGICFVAIAVAEPAGRGSKIIDQRRLCLQSDDRAARQDEAAESLLAAVHAALGHDERSC